uniref:Nicolin-1 n=1 Tax=Timema shepardi TaxID=629360 RepID=A0A7R9G1C7_TIMSH|nr:unnamed protein product [Timema shepardi]
MTATSLSGTEVSNLACRTSRQRLSFDMRGPIRINLDKIEGTCGCAVIDLLFPAPICVGELVFYNYYTAWVTILVPSQPPQTQEDQHNSSKITMEPNQNTTSDIDKTSSQGAIPRSSSKQKELGGWTVSIRKHLLMKHPHYEEGSQDFISIPATKSEVKWNNLVAMRLLLFQPSPYWQTFHIEQINLYREVPPPVPEPILNILGVIKELDLNRQNNSLLSLMHFQTQASLDHNHCTDKDDSEPVTGNTNPQGCFGRNIPTVSWPSAGVVGSSDVTTSITRGSQKLRLRDIPVNCGVAQRGPRGVLTSYPQTTKYALPTHLVCVRWGTLRYPDLATHSDFWLVSPPSTKVPAGLPLGGTLRGQLGQAGWPYSYLGALLSRCVLP